MKLLLSLLLLSGAYGQAASPSWLNRLVNTEEHLIHREEVGPYLVSGDGQRLLDTPYLKLDIRYQGERIPPSSKVEVSSTLYHGDEMSTARYTPEVENGLFVIDPLELPSAEAWTWGSGWLSLSISVDGPVGEGQGSVAFEIYPPKPEAGRLFSLVNFGLPFILLGLFAVIYRVRRVRLQRYHSQV